MLAKKLDFTLPVKLRHELNINICELLDEKENEMIQKRQERYKKSSKKKPERMKESVDMFFVKKMRF